LSIPRPAGNSTPRSRDLRGAALPQRFNAGHYPAESFQLMMATRAARSVPASAQALTPRATKPQYLRKVASWWRSIVRISITRLVLQPVAPHVQPRQTIDEGGANRPRPERAATPQAPRSIVDHPVSNASWQCVFARRGVRSGTVRVPASLEKCSAGCGLP